MKVEIFHLFMVIMMKLIENTVIVSLGNYLMKYLI